MTQLPSNAFYNVEEIAEVLEATVQRSTNRVVGDAIMILRYVNGKIARKAHTSTDALAVSTYYIKLSTVALKQELGFTESQIKAANKLLSENNYMEALTPKMVDGEWVNIWKVGPSMGKSMTQFVTSEAVTEKELQYEFARWVGINWVEVIPEDHPDPVSLLTEENLSKLKEIWLARIPVRMAIIAAQMDDLNDMIK